MAGSRPSLCSSCGRENAADARRCAGCGVLLTSGRDRSLTADAPKAGNPATVPGPHALPLPTFLAGRYELRRFLGRGTSKEVFLARDLRLERDVALGFVNTAGLSTASVARLRHELRALATLGDHPHIVTVYDTGQQDTVTYLVSRYMEGGSVAELLARTTEGQLPVDVACRIAAQVAAALQQAHAHGVVHRDVKPANVWLTADGTAVLGDFGVALSSGWTRQTVEGGLVGTVDYLSPEQATGGAVDGRSDLYSLGVMLYELLCGRPPFSGRDPVSVISQHLHAAPVSPSVHNARVTAPLETLVLHLLAKEADHRPASASEVRRGLERLALSPNAALGSDASTMNPLDRLGGPAFVARDAETARLRSAFEEAVAGRGRLILLVGDAGIGKTRCAEELATYVRIRGGRVLWGRCQEDRGAPAYWPWLEAIRTYLRKADGRKFVAGMGHAAAEIARVVSEVGDLLPEAPPPTSMPPDEARFRFFEGVATFAMRAAEAEPLLIVLDDLHWADQPSLLLLQFLAHSLPTTRTLVVGTYRDMRFPRRHPLARIRGELTRGRHADRVVLRGLDRSGVAQFIQLTAGRPVEGPLIDAVFHTTEGNPFFVTEVVRMLATEGRLNLPARSGIPTRLAIPETVQDVIGSRLAGLSDTCNDMLNVASVIGRQFHASLVARVWESSGAALVAAIDEAVAARILADVGSGDGPYRFSHSLVQEALYDDLRESERLRLHHRTGLALEQIHADDPGPHLAAMAHHFVEAAPLGDTERALHYAVAAAEHADAQLGYEDAARQYERAMRVLDGSDAGAHARRVEMLLALGDCYERAGDTQRTKATFRRAAALARQGALPEHLARAALGHGRAPGEIGVPDDVLIDLLEQALSALDEHDSVLRSRVMARLAVALYYSADRDRCDVLSREAVAIARRVDDTLALATALASRRWAIWRPSTLEERRAVADESLRLAKEDGDSERILAGHLWRLYDLLELGAIEEADGEIDCYERLAAELRQPCPLAFAEVLRTMRALFAGSFELAERLADRAARDLRRAQDPDADQIHAIQAFTLRREQGNLADIDQLVREIADQHPRLPAWRCVLTLLLSELGDERRAAATFDALAHDDFADIPEDATWLIAMASLSETCAFLGDRRHAAHLYAKLQPFAGRNVVLDGWVCWGSVARNLGLLAGTLGQHDLADAHLREALDRNAAMGARPWVAHVELDRARVLTGRDGPGDRHEAAELTASALATARELGMTRLEASITRRQPHGDLARPGRRA